MLPYLAAYGASLVALAVLDGLWIGVVAKDLYKKTLGPLLAPQPKTLPAVLFYLVYPAGIDIFAVARARMSGDWQLALSAGLLFGFFVYATYDLTNWAVVRDWPARLLAFDLPWGTALGGAIAVAGYFAATLI